MKKESLILKLYVEHYKKNSKIDFNTFGFRYDIEMINPESDTLDNRRGHYVLAFFKFKGSVVGTVYVDSRDGMFSSYRLVIGSPFLLACQFVKKDNLFRETHSTLQSCLDQVEKVRCYIVDYFVAQ